MQHFIIFGRPWVQISDMLTGFSRFPFPFTIFRQMLAHDCFVPYPFQFAGIQCELLVGSLNKSQKINKFYCIDSLRYYFTSVRSNFFFLFFVVFLLLQIYFRYSLVLRYINSSRRLLPFLIEGQIFSSVLCVS